MRNNQMDRAVQQEVQRQTAVIQRELNDKIAGLEEQLFNYKTIIAEQNADIAALTGKAYYFGTIVKAQSQASSDVYKVGDEIVVVEPNHEFLGCIGKILELPNSDRLVKIELEDQAKTTLSMSIGSETTLPQFKPTLKNDGTFVTVSVDGKIWEVKHPNFPIAIGDPVKINPETKVIIEKGYRVNAGTIAKVSAITSAGVEIEDKNEKKLVQNALGLTLKEGDRVVVDGFIIVEKIPEDNSTKYRLTSEPNITWEDIGGIENAKLQLQQAIEWPILYPELFEFYSIPKETGFLIYGPPGCGKTLAARAVASSVAKHYGKEATESGYIFVKGPEILSKWVGNAEAEIRSLFERARNHFKQFGYPAILAIDEAESIMPQRGSRVSSDISDTTVPMFLGEMDGIDEEQTKSNPIVLLLTNRPDIMDQAVIRSGRINQHVKIDRPNEDAAIQVLKIHSAKIPFTSGINPDQILMLVVSDIFSKSKILYKVNGEHTFCFADCLNGAILKSVTIEAKKNALHRDMKAGNKGIGVGYEDFKFAVNKLYNEQKGLGHNYDLIDFAEKLGIQAKDMKVDRCFAN